MGKGLVVFGVGLVAFVLVLVYNGLLLDKIGTEEQLGLRFWTEFAADRGVLKRLTDQLNTNEKDFQAAVKRFSHAMGFRTVSHTAPHNSTEWEWSEFDRFLEYLEKSFPRVHSELKRTKLDCHSLLFEWTGSDSKLDPFLLAAHMDVVPIEDGTQSRWTRAPFCHDDNIHEGFIYGRGTLDDKIGVFSVLEATERLLSVGFKPKRTMLIAMGHDEEVGGQGAANIALMLKKRGIRLMFVVDEGGAVVPDAFPRIGKLADPSIPGVAVVGVAEKGYISVNLDVETEGGHSSMPKLETPIGILSQALARVEQNQMPARLRGGIFQTTLESIAPSLGFVPRILFGNLWLFEPLVVRFAQSKPAINAQIRTTTALTVLKAGAKDNVLPSRAHATINFRVLPGDNAETIFQHLRSVINDDRVVLSRFVEVNVDKDADPEHVHPTHFGTGDPSPLSSTTSEGWETVVRAVKETFPGVPTVPYLVVGATDARYYYLVSDSVYRFSPVVLTNEDLKRIHGTNERISIENYRGAIKFYLTLIIDAQSHRSFADESLRARLEEL